MNESLGSIESNIRGLRGETGGLRQEIAGLRKDTNAVIGELRHELHTNFRWTTGTIIAMWVTVVCAIVFV